MNPENIERHRGSCHCGAVRYEVQIDAGSATRCNCSACTKTGVTGGIVKPSSFALLAGEADLGVYEWGPRISKRFFCKHCGVHCFARGHLAEVGGDYVSINYNTLDEVELSALKLTYWDGRHDNWRAGTRTAPWPLLDASP